MRTKLLVVSCVLVGFASTASAQTPATQCSGLTKLQVPGFAVEITKADWIAAVAAAAALQPVRLRAARRRRSLPHRRRHRSPGRCWQPAVRDWLCAGDAGELERTFLLPGWRRAQRQRRQSRRHAGDGECTALARGFAVVSTDTGHTGTAFDGAFMQDQQAALDFAFVAIGRVAVLAKQIIAQHYGRPAEKSYYVGCSTGGREAMVMAQRYPTYFDGIISGAPAMRTGYSNLATRSVAVALNQAAPKDASGQPLPAQIFSDADKKTIIDGLANACDDKDGLKDGLIFNTRGCKFDPKVVACSGAKKDGCLSAQQVSALEKAFAGPRDSKGRQVYPPFPWDTGITATGGGIPGLLSPGNSPLGPPNRSLQQDVDAEAAQQAMNAQAVIGDTYTWTNLSTFASRGGKLLFYHGVSDPWFSANDTIDYYTRLGAANGGADQVQTWSRLFLSPGMGHCQGGQSLDTFDLLTALVDWVEKGVAPASVTATGRALPGRSRPLCAYPKSATYKGSGDPESAASFECR